MACSESDVRTTVKREGERVVRLLGGIEEAVLQMGNSVIHLDASSEKTPGTCCCDEDGSGLWKTMAKQSNYTGYANTCTGGDVPFSMWYGNSATENRGGAYGGADGRTLENDEAFIYGIGTLLSHWAPHYEQTPVRAWGKDHSHHFVLWTVFSKVFEIWCCVYMAAPGVAAL